MVRNSLRFVSWKERKKVASDLRAIYTALTLEAAEQALDAFGAKWDERFPTITKSWRTHWSVARQPNLPLRRHPGSRTLAS
jgi:transposase-like protein